MTVNFASQSFLDRRTNALHVAVIMDGNGRWAAARGLPRPAGHRAGAAAVRRVIERAREANVGTLTLYAFSSDNWGRPRTEVRALMALFEEHLAVEARRCREHGIRLRVIGRRDRLRPPLLEAIRRAEAQTAGGMDMDLYLAVDYSSRHALAVAGPPPAAGTTFSERRRGATGVFRTLPDVDLLVRTGGERRLSDFLLWECAYAELYFTDVAWPDFGRDEFAAALEWYRSRARRFGRLPAPAAAGREAGG